MKLLKFFITNLLVFNALFSYSQQFWKLTNEFWGGPKTGIALVDDSVLLVSTTTGIMKSTDEGKNFESMLTASSVHTVFVTSFGHIFAGGTGKIYVSEDLGLSWDSVMLNTSFPIKQIIENDYHTLFAITGINNDGDGVFCSEDEGKTWESRNNGIGKLKACENIVADKNGRLYLTIADAYSTNEGGLFISETYGLSWQKINLKIDSLIGPVKVIVPTGLSISPNDSLYLSFYGVAYNILVQLNICKSLADVTLENSWQKMHVDKNENWWLNKPLNNIHFSQKGDWYSSFTQLANNGATYFSDSKGKNWSRIIHGLGSSEDGWRFTQHFVEKSTGRIFMIQFLDERIYTTDKSMITGINVPEEKAQKTSIFPNPVRAGENFTIQAFNNDLPLEVNCYDLTGKLIFKQEASGTEHQLIAPPKPGLYFIVVQYQNKTIKQKLLIL